MSQSLPPAEVLIAHDSDQVELFQLCGLEIAAYSRVSPNKDTPNEDAAAIIPVSGDAAVFVVADGCGGMRGGNQASALAIETLVQTTRENGGDGYRLRSTILDGIEHANKHIVDLSIGAATTIAAVEFFGGSIRPYHVGDSMILVVGRNGKIKLQTVSHSPVGFAVESGLLDEEEALHHDERHVVSNVLGDVSMRIELGPSIKLARFDTVLIASDGLFDNLFPDEIADGIRKGNLLDSFATIIQIARSRMQEPVPGKPHKADDLTVIAFRLSNGAGTGADAGFDTESAEDPAPQPSTTD
ncbi:MAG: protein phosphatase 2C domain-containing protein [Planctomycetota bacterium]|nr:protein phosphatase 2C domain-containing protein [Planctomycetota bacterium]MDA1249135.1 protein phosphatase 2C domain-containing protein [Planctomycetota bacterium]